MIEEIKRFLMSTGLIRSIEIKTEEDEDEILRKYDPTYLISVTFDCRCEIERAEFVVGKPAWDNLSYIHKFYFREYVISKMIEELSKKEVSYFEDKLVSLGLLNR